jgi:hypothetical protein
MVEWNGGMVEQWNGGTMEWKLGKQFHKHHAVSSGELVSFFLLLSTKMGWPWQRVGIV